MGKKLREEDLILNIIVNGDRGKKEIGQLNRAIKDTNAEIRALEKQQKELIASGQKESEQYKAVTAAIKQKNEALILAESRLKQLKSQTDINQMSLRDLRSEMTRISRLRNIATPGTEEWIKQGKELEKVKARYAELRGEANNTAGTMGKLTSSISSSVGILAASAVSFTAVVSGIRRASDEYARFDDQVADVMKTTNLAKEDVLEINENLKSLDTRSSQEELLSLGRIAGKLGIDVKEDVEGFIRAADQIGVALAEDLGGDVETAIREVGKLVDIFGVSEEFNIEQSLLKVGSAINDLGMASTANEGYLVDFAKRLGGAASAAEISIADILGMGATLDQFGQSVEVGGTALSQLILNIFDDTSKFARIAGQEVGEFSKLLKEDTNEALIQLFEGVKGNESSMEELVARLGELNIDGARARGVVLALANNTEVLREQQEIANKAFEEGTSISDEFAIKNTTAAAQLDKLKRRVTNLWTELGEKLHPAMMVGNSIFANLLSLLISVIGFFTKNYKIIITLTTAIVAYNAVLAISNARMSAGIALSKIKVFWDNAQRASLILLSAAQALFTGNLGRATAAMRLFNMVSNLNPYALLASAIIALGTAFYIYSRRLTDAEKVQKTFNDAIIDAEDNVRSERIEIERSMRAINDNTASRDEKLIAINSLRKIMPDVLQNYTDEEILAGKATVAIEAQTKAIIANAKAQAFKNKITELAAERAKIEEQKERGFKGATLGERFGTIGNIFSGDYEAAYEKTMDERIALIDAQSKKVEDALLEQQKISLGNTLPKVTGNNTTVDPDPVIPSGGKNPKDKEDKEAKRAEDERNRELERIAAYRQKVLEGQLSLIEQERLAHQRRLEQAGLAGKQRQDLTEEEYKVLLALEKEHYSNLDNLDADAISKDIDRRQAAFEDQLSELRIHHNEQFKEIKTMEQARAALQGELSNEALAGLQNMRQAQRELDKKFRREEEALVREHLENLQAELQAALQSGSFTGVNLADEVLSDEEKEVLLGRLNEVRKILSELGLGSGTEIAEDAGRRVGNVDLLGFSPDDWTTFFDNLENGRLGLDDILMGVQTLQSMWTQYNAFVAAGEARQMQQFESNTRAKEERLKRQLDAGVINQDTYNQQIDKLNADLDRKKAVYERNQAKRERNVALMSAIVNTASAVAAALPNLFLAALVGTMGGLQIGTILKTPLPEIPGAEDGGRLMDVTRSQDRKMFRAQVDFARRGYVDRPTIIAGESGREFVANDKAVRNPTIKPVIDAIDTAQRNGTIDSLNLNKVMEQNQMLRAVIPGRQKGGRIFASTAVSPVASSPSSSVEDVKSLLQQNLRIMSLLSDQLAQPITAEVVLTGRKGLIDRQNELASIEKSANL